MPNAERVEAEPETEVAALRRELLTWKHRCLSLETAFASRPGRLVVIRAVLRPLIERVNDFARIEAGNDVVLMDQDALRLACREVGLEVVR